MAITRNNTTVTRNRDGATVCTLHSTQIVKAHDNYVVLDSGGWQTVTTKRRMNECFREWDLPLSVFQKDFDWFVDTPHGRLEFRDGMQIAIS